MMLYKCRKPKLILHIFLMCLVHSCNANELEHYSALNELESLHIAILLYRSTRDRRMSG